MQLDRISYQKVFPIGSYATERIGLEASLDKDENPEVALQRLSILVNDLHSATIANLEHYRGTSVVDIPETKVDKVPDEVQAVLDGIENSPDMKELSSFWLKSKGNLMLLSAYKSKEKQLTNAK
jgi:hypothetical protein